MTEWLLATEPVSVMEIMDWQPLLDTSSSPDSESLSISKNPRCFTCFGVENGTPLTCDVEGIWQCIVAGSMEGEIFWWLIASAKRDSGTQRQRLDSTIDCSLISGQEVLVPINWTKFLVEILTQRHVNPNFCFGLPTTSIMHACMNGVRNNLCEPSYISSA